MDNNICPAVPSPGSMGLLKACTMRLQYKDKIAEDQRTHSLLRVVVDEMGKVQGVGHDGQLEGRLVVEVDDMTVRTSKQQHSAALLLCRYRVQEHRQRGHCQQSRYLFSILW